MRFFCTGNANLEKINNSLRTYGKNNSPQSLFFFLSEVLGISRRIFPLKKMYRRTSSDATTKYKGSMTVEAALILPIFIFCIVNLLFGLRVIETSGRITAALHETGNEICSFGYINDDGETVPGPKYKCSVSYASASVRNHLGKTVNGRGGIKGGLAGIDFSGTDVRNDSGIVKINASYYLKFPIDMGIKSYRLGTSYYGHAWIGYDVTDGITDETEDDPIVYITPSGTVYHLNIDCMHLNPHIETTDLSSIESKRNSSGAIYYPCESCGIKSGLGTVYITPYGNRYHCDVSCPGLKRTIRAVHLSQAGGRRQCMTCGK